MAETQPLLGPQQHAPPQQVGWAHGAPGDQGQPPPLYKGEVPDEDVHENASSNAPHEPSAPPISLMDPVTGYENISFQTDKYVPPPTYAEATAASEPPPVHMDFPRLTEEGARDSLLDMVSSHCCYGKGAARQLVIMSISPSSGFHYQLETFTEGRKTAWVYEPYSGQMIDGPQNGPAPAPWDIQAQPNATFQDHTKHFEVPHTASVKVCHSCMGAGMKRCWMCLGRGRVICGTCDGTGRTLRTVVHRDHHHGHHHHGHHHHHHDHVHTDVERVFCHMCNGSGRRRCLTCGGCGQVHCSTCSSRGNLKCYIKLTVTWKTNKVDRVVERTALPDHLIRGAQGRTVFEDQQRMVVPVTTFPDSAVNSASQELVRAHSTAFPTERILVQRHWIRMIPVSEVNCQWKGTTFSYWVYGFDNQVHAPDYPQQCCGCCGCSIL